MPVLGDLYHCLRSQKEPQAQRIATALEIYVNGSLKVFNHQTNVQLDNRIVCFDIKDLGKQLKKLGMLIVQDQVWNRVTINRAAHKTTRYYLRVPSSFEGGTDGFVQCRNLEALSQMGRHPHRDHAKCQRPVIQPRG